MDYALIENGVVSNIIFLRPQNAASFPGVVPLNDVPASIGDTYVDGAFYRGGERVLSYAERLEQEKADMAEALALLGVAADE
jgi:hypothetical protein